MTENVKTPRAKKLEFASVIILIGLEIYLPTHVIALSLINQNKEENFKHIRVQLSQYWYRYVARIPLPVRENGGRRILRPQ